ncbi:MAG: pseudouridine synthase [Saprospiraceae bacterium]
MSRNALTYFLVYKPYGMLSQFQPDHPGQATLSDLGGQFPRDAYPIGRLDADSEGLLLISNDKNLPDLLLPPQRRRQRTYWAQVEGLPDTAALDALRQGVTLRIDGKTHRTLPAEVRLLDAGPDGLPERIPPIRFRQHIPTAWIEIVLREGKNRQVRRMCAAVGHPVLRLVRARIGRIGLGAYGLGALKAGQIIALSPEQVAALCER